MKEEELERAKSLCEKVLDAVGEVFVGKRSLLRKLLAAGLANGHVLFEDYPGLGKTLLAKVFARSIGCQFTRIQFTPDLLPADILGTKIWRPQSGSFELMRGPIFTNVLLSDEINRSPPKTQSALLEAMEERQVTIEGETFPLEAPFFVLATQNPIELEGTYPLPEAQMDRFLFRLSIGYPDSLASESTVLTRRVSWQKDDPTLDIRPVMTQQEFVYLQGLVEKEVYIDRSILEYITGIVRATREHPKVEVGCSPRAGIALLKGSRALALVQGRDFVTPDDVKELAVDTLAHRVILNVEEAIEGFQESQVIEEALQRVPVPTEFRPR